MYFASVNEYKPIANQIWLGHAAFRDILSDKFDDKWSPSLHFFASLDRGGIKFTLPFCAFSGDRQIWVNLRPQKRVLKFINLKFGARQTP